MVYIDFGQQAGSVVKALNSESLILWVNGSSPAFATYLGKDLWRIRSRGCGLAELILRDQGRPLLVLGLHARRQRLNSKDMYFRVQIN